MSKDSPDPPDYEAAAERQAESSREVTEQQTWANRPDQNTPFGSVSWENTPTLDPATGQTLNRWTQNTTLNPQSQAALDAQMGVTLRRSNLASDLTDRLQSEYQDRVNFDNFQGMGAVPQARNLSSSDDVRNRAEEAIYGRMTSRLDPRFQQEEGDLRTRLYNQGLREGDPAFQREIDNFGRGKTDAYTTAMRESIMGGGEEGQRSFDMQRAEAGQEFGQEMDSANYQNQLRQQQIVESMTERGYTLNEINAMLTGQQVGMPQMPDFSTAQRSEATQYSQAARDQYGAELDAFNAEQAATQGMMSGAAGMFAFSDRRLKKNIREIGIDRHGNKIYLYNYLGSEEPRIGVMADEIDQKYVVRHPSGYDMVNYGALYG